MMLKIILDCLTIAVCIGALILELCYIWKFFQQEDPNFTWEKHKQEFIAEEAYKLVVAKEMSHTQYFKSNTLDLAKALDKYNSSIHGGKNENERKDN